jgi:hypothetical protein
VSDPQRVNRLSVWLVVVTAGLLPGVSRVAAGEYEKSLPQECIFVVNIDDSAGLMARIRETSLGGLMRDPSMGPFVEGIKNEFGKLFEMAQQASGVDFKELLSVPSGQVLFAIRVHEPKPDDVPFFYFLANVGGKEEKVRGLFGRLETALEQRNMKKRSAGGLTIFSEGEPKPREQLCYSLQGPTLVMGNDPDALANVVSGLKSGARPSLAENERFRAFRERAGGAGDLEVFLDLSALMNIGAAQAGPQAGAVIAMFGLNAIQSVGFSCSVGKGDFESQLQFMLNTRGQSQLFNLFRMPTKPLRPEEWVPQDVSGYSTFNWDVDLFYDTLSNIVNGVAPGALASADAAAAMIGGDPNNPVIRSIKDDLIGPLGNRITLLTDLVESEGLPASRILVAWELDNGEKIARILDALMNSFGPAVQAERKSVKGGTVHIIPGPPIPGLPPMRFAFTATKRHLLFTTHVELLDKVLTAEGRPGLSESEDFRRLAGRFPAQVSGISYNRAEAEFRALWRMVKSGQLSQMLQAGLAQDPNAQAALGGLVEAFNGKNLPEFDSIRKYVKSTGGYAVMDDQGLKLVSFSVK